MNEVALITQLRRIDSFKAAADKLLLGSSLTNREASLLLSAAVLLLRSSSTGSNRPRSIELAYWIVLNYSLNTSDFRPLYEFSFELGLYPISKSLFDIDNAVFEKLSDCIAHAKIEDGFTEGVTLTLEQRMADKSFFSYCGDGFAYIAPTSFGKTERLVGAALGVSSGTRPCIIVPTKSLLAQTREDVFRRHPRAKVITHDEMYQGEGEFIAILTQERAIRLLEACPELSFTSLFVDEAHNAFGTDDRALLISRLVREAKFRNPHTRCYFFSPIIDEIGNLSAISGFEVAGYKISKSMKEPRYYLLDDNGSLRAYNRFFDSFCDHSHFNSVWDCLISRGAAKNLVFLASPRKIREAALEFSKNLPNVAIDPGLQKMLTALSEHVSPMYDELTCLCHGVVYLHGQMPDGVKNYLLDRASKLESIRFIFANSVIMEGINLPFESVFILNLRTKKPADLINLIGRASRLNYVFADTPNLEKLCPQVVFVNSKWSGARISMENAIKQLHKAGFKDREDNIRIKESKGKRLKAEERVRLDFENHLIRSSKEADSNLEILLDRSGLCSFYEGWGAVRPQIAHRLGTLAADSNEDVFEPICKFFVDGSCFNFSRTYRRIGSLRSQADFYRKYQEGKASQSLSQRLASDINYWTRKSEKTGTLLYVGSSFGELDSSGRVDGNTTYVDLRQKSGSELPALFLAKYKEEDDYLGYVLSRFVRVLFKTNHITHDQYHMFIYGVTDEKSIELIQAGIPLSLVKMLQEVDLLDDVSFDLYGNAKIGRRLQDFSKEVDDYTAFEIEQLFIS